MKWIFLALAVAVLAPLSAAQGCTEEALLCADGSFAKRIPPSCNFTACPEPTTTPVPVSSTAEQD